MLSGLPAVFSILALISDAGALPWLVGSWSVLIISGYRIWRARNPRRSALHEIAWRSRAALSTVGLTLAVLLIGSSPTALVIGIGMILGVIALATLVVVIAERA
jgi:hypothetical protein